MFGDYENQITREEIVRVLSNFAISMILAVDRLDFLPMDSNLLVFLLIHPGGEWLLMSSI
jgi:hypothetical protein